MKTAYLLERMNDETGKYEPYELELYTHCNIWEDPAMEDCHIDIWPHERVEEFPDVFISCGDDWDFRLGVMVTDAEVDANGGVYEGTAVVNECNDEPWKYRIRRVEVSGRPSKEFSKWLAENPDVKWHC